MNPLSLIFGLIGYTIGEAIFEVLKEDAPKAAELDDQVEAPVAPTVEAPAAPEAGAT